jgi:hypothetical protein
MNTRSLLLVLIVLAGGSIAFGQKTVTNADLERYRSERTRAEEQLRQEFARKGTSYEEVMRRNKQSQQEMIELSAKLTAERLEQERVDAEREAAVRVVQAFRGTLNAFNEPYGSGGWFSGFRYRGGGRIRYGARPVRPQQGYFAGGQFWPTGPATRPQPLFSVGRH